MDESASDPLVAQIGAPARVRRLLIDLIALALILIAPLIVLLDYHDYDYLAPEALMMAGLAFGAAAILALLFTRLNQLVRAVVLSLLLALFLDIHSGLQRLSSLVVITAFALTVAGLSLVLWLLREHATKIVSVIFVTLIGLTLLIPKGSSHSSIRDELRAASFDRHAPLFIHLILDEHIGVQGLPPQIRGARQLRSDLIDFYVSRGFRLHGRAYSEYANTNNSIANLVNFTSLDIDRSYVEASRAEADWDLTQAAYFRELQQRGYRLQLYQSSYMNLCHAQGVRPRKCLTYPATSFRAVQDIELASCDKARLIANALVTESQLLRVLNRVYERVVRPRLARVGWELPPWGWQKSNVGPLTVPLVFERLLADILANPRGHAFFAHLILPHYPYVFDRRCQLRAHTSDWLSNRLPSSNVLIHNTAQSREARYERYFEQVYCVTTMIERLVSTLDRHGLLEDATIIVHGDHGSRIPEHFPSRETLAGGLLTQADYIDTYSTLYAIRTPGVSPGYVADPASVVDLLSHYVSGAALSTEQGCRVFLTSEDANPALTTAQQPFCGRGISITTAADSKEAVTVWTRPDGGTTARSADRPDRHR